MQVEPAQIEEIFGEAVAQADAAARAAYLRQACGDNAELRARVEALLAAHDATGNFLKLPGGDQATAPFLPLSEGPGTLIGPYKLLEQIGEGGMGVVYMADQQAPVRRRVALKVIKTGMDTRQVVARFEAERQALAMMDHPSIAKVLDAGATDTGRPYFVMDLVKGVPVTEYCDKHSLSISQRLELFGQICQAVQHAHQKGLIHRDIKPNNVLVSTQDDRPVAKVIDFGVAKAMQARLTEKTLFTEFRQLIGTPAYMSPEQAEGDLDVDTRSDVYSLGVLLYELLTGSPPFDPKELRSKAFAEMQRIICEVEPPTPSTRLSTLTDTLPSVAAHRAIEPRKLAAMLRGELDWIVMRCLEKDRKRRYQSANSLADDLQRYLADEPIEARPATQLYRLKKFIRRNKAGVLAGSAIAAALIVGLGLSTWMFVRERAARVAEAEQRTQAEANEKKALGEASKNQQVTQFLKEMLGGVIASPVEGRDTSLLREIVDKSADRVGIELKDQPEVQAELLETIGVVYCETGPLEKAEEMQREALNIRRQIFGDEHKDVASSLSALGFVRWRQGNHTDAERLFRQAVQIQRKLGWSDNPDAVKSLVFLGGILFFEGKQEESEVVTREAVHLMNRLHSEASWQYGWALMNLGRILNTENKLDEAESTLRDAVAITRKWDPDESHVADALLWLGNVLQRVDKQVEAETVMREAVALHRKRSDQQRDPYLAWALEALAGLLDSQGRLGEAEDLLQESLEIKKRALGDKHTETTGTRNSLIDLLQREDDFAEADRLFEDGLKQAADSAPETSAVLRARGDAHGVTEHWDEAVAALTQAVDIDPDHEHASLRLAVALLKAGREEEYRKHCHAYLARTADNGPFHLAERAARSSLLLPVAGDDFARACDLADYAATVTEAPWGFAFFYSVKALAEYRRERFESAIEWVDRCVSAKIVYPVTQAEAWFIHAGAAARLQRIKDAQDAFAKGDELLKQARPNADDWAGWASADILRAEAAELLGIADLQPSTVPAPQP